MKYNKDHLYYITPDEPLSERMSCVLCGNLIDTLGELMRIPFVGDFASDHSEIVGYIGQYAHASCWEEHHSLWQKFAEITKKDIKIDFPEKNNLLFQGDFYGGWMREVFMQEGVLEKIIILFLPRSAIIHTVEFGQGIDITGGSIACTEPEFKEIIWFLTTSTKIIFDQLIGNYPSVFRKNSYIRSMPTSNNQRIFLSLHPGKFAKATLQILISKRDIELLHQCFSFENLMSMLREE